MKRTTMMLVMVILAVILMVISCTPAAQQCSTDQDCVPAQCCHATGAVNKANAPDCSGILCTMSCEPDSIDCGQGEIKCVSDRCAVVMN